MAAKSFRTKDNLRKAWKWLKSNPDRIIKDSYGMRKMYHDFTVTEDVFIDEIYTELRDGTYTPTPACKVYLPKPSGGLRPYSLLIIKDQIVYQALVNIIAEQLYPKIKNRYYKKVFGHLYAGGESTWFYKKWQTGYKKFNTVARGSFAAGRTYMATFDLVACYDSMDHQVLSHYLTEVGVQRDAIDLLRRCLVEWTSTDHNERIYQGHGIPQGPMSSGFLSEVVLQAFDSEKTYPNVTYLRYVDDIWFFAENEQDLRTELVRMDRVCKKIGLFPQSSKINIEQIKDIEGKLKTVSGVFESIEEIEKENYLKELKEVTPSYKINDISKFRYCAARANPSAVLIDRLWRIFENRPDIYPQLCSVIIRSGKLTKSSQRNIKHLLGSRNPYINIHASFIEVLCRINLSNHEAIKFSKIVKAKFGTGKVFRDSDSRLTALVFEFLYKNKRLTPQQIKWICKSPFWYTRREIANFLDHNDSQHIKSFLFDSTQDVQLTAASNVVARDIQIPAKTLRTLPHDYFNKFDLITAGVNEPCKINLILSKMLSQKINVNWKRLLDTRYRQALITLVNCSAAQSTDVGTWLNRLDVFNDIVIKALADFDVAVANIGNNYGAVLNDTTHAFYIKYKDICLSCKKIHDRRSSSIDSHAYETKTNKPTKPFKYREVAFYTKQEIKIITELLKISPN